MEKNPARDHMKKRRGEFIAAHSTGPEALKALKAWDAIEGERFMIAFAAVRAYRLALKDAFDDLGAEAFEAVCNAFDEAMDMIDAETEAKAKEAGMTPAEYMMAVVEAEKGGRKNVQN